ncbi:MAG: DUF4256 domain-containing protein, partial [Clostridiales bacterium]|nr:DUF4256 domain-containing protein [Clostridiales bacterium]
MKNHTLSRNQQEDLLKILEERFNKYIDRHNDIKWEDVKERLIAKPDKMWSLLQMEDTGGEPDVIAYDKDTGEFIFCDCSPETPSGRRSICFDKEARESRKKNKPESSA